VASQPSPEKGPPSPSSHASPLAIMLSPQTVEQTLGVVGDPTVHEYPGKFPVQSDLHPTPSFAIPSSHISFAYTSPSMQLP